MKSNKNIVLIGMMGSGKSSIGFLISKKLKLDFFDVKALAENVLDTLGGDGDCQPSQLDWMFPDQAMDLMANGNLVGYFGLLHPSFLQRYKIKSRLAVISIDLTHIASTERPAVPQFAPIPRYPSTRRDVAFVVAKDFPYADIYAAFWTHKPEQLVHIELFDYFESDQFSSDQIGMGLSFTYQSETGTLTDQDIDPVHENYVRTMLDHLPIAFR